uniref:Uncharacterized protein n=1 Tax=Panagrolaimus davidi TaxID=227884 RepID=A0A914Q531_9BILA
MSSREYHRHYRDNHYFHFAHVSTTTYPTVSTNLSTRPSVQPTAAEDDPRSKEMDAAINRIFKKADEMSSSMQKQMNLNRKTVMDAHLQVLEAIKTTVAECKFFMGSATGNRLSTKIDCEIRKRSSYYKRLKTTEDSPYYIPPKKHIVNYRMEQNPNRDTVLWRPNNTARISIKDNLKRLFSLTSLTAATVFPSDFTNSSTYGHPFTGERAQLLYEKLGSDFIGLSIYCDEFGTVNPLGQAAATNKIMACYFRVNNFVVELQDSNLIFLGFLAYSIDVKQEGFRELLKNLLVPQLAELENGIEVPYKGQTTVLPVILLNILGDNLGNVLCNC